MKSSTVFALAALPLLAACADPHMQPGVASYDNDKVILVQPHAVRFTDQQLVSRAQVFCQMGTNKTAVRVSSHKLPRPHGVQFDYRCTNGY